jgi:SAM-dependent methyltransferase
MEIRDSSGVPLDPDRQRYWNERYAAEGDVWGLEPNRFVAAALGDVPPGRALDLGAGQGRNAVWLAKKGHQVTAVDLSSVAIDRARQLAVGAGVTIDALVADLNDWEPEPEVFDLVLLSYLQFATPLRSRVHAMARHALSPGGTLFVVAHHRDNLGHGVGGPQVEELLFTETQLAADFRDLDVVMLETVLRPVDGADRPAIDVVMRARKAQSTG